MAIAHGLAMWHPDSGQIERPARAGGPGGVEQLGTEDCSQRCLVGLTSRPQTGAASTSRLPLAVPLKA